MKRSRAASPLAPPDLVALFFEGQADGGTDSFVVLDQEDPGAHLSILADPGGHAIRLRSRPQVLDSRLAAARCVRTVSGASCLRSAQPDLRRPDGALVEAQSCAAGGEGQADEVLHVRLCGDRPDGPVEPDVGDVDVETLRHLLVGRRRERGGSGLRRPCWRAFSTSGSLFLVMSMARDPRISVGLQNT